MPGSTELLVVIECPIASLLAYQTLIVGHDNIYCFNGLVVQTSYLALNNPVLGV